MVWGAAQRGIDDLVERVQRSDPSLTSLCILRGRRFDDDGAKALAAALHANTTLQELTVSSHAVSAAAAAALAAALSANHTLRSLDLGNRTFGDEGVAALAPGIEATTSLKRLVLEAKGLTAAGCRALGAALAGNRSVQELLLGQNDVGGDGLAALLQALGGGDNGRCSSGSEGSDRSPLRLLDCSGCGLQGAAGVEPLAAALQRSRLPSLETLQLDSNQLGEAGGAALAAGLAGGTGTLRSLRLQRCGLGPAATAALAAALPAALRVLDLSGNPLGSQGAAALAAALREGAAPQLRKLLLAGCELGDGDAAAFGVALFSPGEGLDLDLSGNAAGPAAVAALARAPLRALCLHDCRLGAEGAAELARQLACPGSFGLLHELDLSGNRLEKPALLPILEALLGGGAAADGAPPAACPRLRLLVLAANPGAADEEVASAVDRLQASRPALDVVRRAADTGEGGLME